MSVRSYKQSSFPPFDAVKAGTMVLPCCPFWSESTGLRWADWLRSLSIAVRCSAKVTPSEAA